MIYGSDNCAFREMFRNSVVEVLDIGGDRRYVSIYLSGEEIYVIVYIGRTNEIVDVEVEEELEYCGYVGSVG